MIHDSILVRASLRSELYVSSLCPNLLVEPVSDFAIDLIQILVGEADMSDRAIWIHESVIDDASSERSRLLAHAFCLLLIHLRVGLSLLLQVMIHLLHFLDELVVSHHRLLPLLYHSLFFLIDTATRPLLFEIKSRACLPFGHMSASNVL